MPLKNYGVLVGRAIDRQLASGSNAHYQVHMIDSHNDYRIAINVMSALAPSELQYLIVSNFSHPLLDGFAALEPGWHPLTGRPTGAGGEGRDVGLDFIRGNLFDPRDMRVLPFNVPGPDNDLNEKLDHYIQRAMADEEAVAYAFGERWGPEEIKDKIFGFAPGNGVHDIHMNQSNVGRFTGDDGVYQDGALLLHFPGQKQWVGIFLKFQSQGWHTDDKTGHSLPGEPQVPSGPPSDQDEPPPGPYDPNGHPTPDNPDGAVRIVAALANGVTSPETETVTLLNTTNAAIDLKGWTLLDRDKHRMALTGVIAAGDTLRVTLAKPAELPNKGGLITLLDARGLRVDGVSYSKAQASRPGYSIKF